MLSSKVPKVTKDASFASGRAIMGDQPGEKACVGHPPPEKNVLGMCWTPEKRNGVQIYYLQITSNFRRVVINSVPGKFKVFNQSLIQNKRGNKSNETIKQLNNVK